MKVLYFMNHVDQGGAALALYDLIVELKKMDFPFEPIVITGRYNELNKKLSKIGVENYSSNFKNFISSYKKPYFLTHSMLCLRYAIGKRKAVRQIEKIIDFNTIDIIHTNLNRIDIGAYFSLKYNIPHVWHIREHANIYTGKILPHMVGNKEEGFSLQSIKLDPIQYMNDYIEKNENNYFVATSNSVKNAWEKKGIQNKKTIVVYDGVREELYNYKKTINESKIKMIFIGGYSFEKGQEEFIKALEYLTEDELKAICIDFYGNGEKKYIKKLKKLSKRYEEKGIVSINNYDSNISERIEHYDVGVNCSHSEGFGRTTVEYMLSGLCPLVSNIEATEEIIQNGFEGIMYKKDDSADLGEKIKYIINNKSLIELIGKRAREKAQNDFSMNNHSTKILDLYKQIYINNRGEKCTNIP